MIDAARPAGDTIEQSIMVYQVGGKDFRVAAETNAGFLSPSISGSGLGDRYKVTASIDPDKLPAGQIRSVASRHDQRSRVPDNRDSAVSI